MPFIFQLQKEVTPVTVALTRKDGRIVRCNGVNANRKLRKQQMYSLPPEYMSQVVVIGIHMKSFIIFCAENCDFSIRFFLKNIVN